MFQRDPILTFVGKVPAVGRTDVRFDYRLGKASAEAGDIQTAREKARSLGRFAIQHAGFLAMSLTATAMHVVNAKNGGVTETLEATYSSAYTLLQASCTYAQAKLSRMLHAHADSNELQLAMASVPGADTASKPANSIPTLTETDRPGKPAGDIAFTAAAHGLFGLAAMHGAVEFTDSF
jgi:hypothetical protein